MDSKQDNNKLRPQDEEQLPVELRWENMEANILQKMEALQSTVPSNRNKNQRRWILLVCLLLLGVLLSALLIFNDEPVAKDTTDIALSQTTAVERTAREEGNEVSEADQLPTISTKQPAATEPTTLRGNIPQGNQQASGIGVEQDESNSHSGNTGEIFKSPAKDTLKFASPEAFQQITDAKQANNVASASLNTDKIPTVNSPNASSLTPVEQLVDHGVIPPVVAQTPSKEVALPIVALSTEPSCPAFKTRSSQVWLMGGASWWSAGYGNTKPERAEFEQAILSSQGQFSYVQPMKKDLFLLVGLQYQQLASRLNWNTLIEDYELTLEDTIIQIRRNVITGEETEVRGDVTLTVPAERQVQHYNSFSLLQVPLGIGKTWGKGNWQSHLLVGGVANLSFSRQGRTLYQAELIDYDDSSSTIWTDQLSFSAMLSGGLSYRITDRLGIMTAVQYQQSLNSWSTEEGITMRPSILNWSLGVNYSL